MKYLSLNTVRVLSLLLTLSNITALFYFGSLYGNYLSIAFICIIFQVLILVFYLLFHIYYVWINEHFTKVFNQQNLNAIGIQNLWKSIEDKNNGLTSALKNMEEGFNSTIQSHFESLSESINRNEEENIAFLKDFKEKFLEGIQDVNNTIKIQEEESKALLLEIKETLSRKIDDYSDSINSKEIERKTLFLEIKETLTGKIDEISESINSKDIERKALISNMKETLDQRMTNIFDTLQTQEIERIISLNATKESLTESLKDMVIQSEDVKQSLNKKLDVTTDELKGLLQFLQHLDNSISFKYREITSLSDEQSEKLQLSITGVSKRLNEKSDYFSSLFEGKIDHLIHLDKERDENYNVVLKKSVEILNTGLQTISTSISAFEESNNLLISELSDDHKKMVKEMISSLLVQLEEVHTVMAKADQVSRLMTKLNDELSASDKELLDSINNNYSKLMEIPITLQENTHSLITEYKEQLTETTASLDHTIKSDILSKLLEIEQAKNLKEYISTSILEANNAVTAHVKQQQVENREEFHKVQNVVLGSEEKILAEFSKNLSEKLENLQSHSSTINKDQIVKIHAIIEDVAKQSVGDLLKVTADQPTQKRVESLVSKAIENFNEQYTKLELGVNESKDLIQKVADGATEVNEKVNRGFNDQKKFVEFNVLKQANLTYDRIDALLSIHNLININSPLPIMHEWTISSDYGNEILRTFLAKGEGNAMDIGSGISTLLLGYAAKKNGKGKVITLEHSKEYYEKTLKLIHEHKLEDFCELNYCPLKTYKIKNKEWLWYDLTKVKIPKKIRIVSIDGPPGATQAMARYPAFPILNKFFDKHTTIYLDDGNREDETSIAEMWVKDFSINKDLNSHYKGFYKFNLK